jgi:hypothetical protein
MTSADATLALTLNVSPGFRVCPTSSEHRYTDPVGTAIAGVLTFDGAALPPLAMRFAVNVADPPLLLLTDTLSMMQRVDAGTV